LVEAVKFLARHKWLFDQGMLVSSQLVGIVQTSLLIALNGDRLRKLTGIGSTLALIVLAGLAYVFGTWALGFVLDLLDFPRRYADVCNSRNRVLAGLDERTPQPPAEGWAVLQDCYVSCRTCKSFFFIKAGEPFRWPCRKCGGAA
jgi:hypothetical protein